MQYARQRGVWIAAFGVFALIVTGVISYSGKIDASGIAVLGLLSIGVFVWGLARAITGELTRPPRQPKERLPLKTWDWITIAIIAILVVAAVIWATIASR